MKVVPDSSDLCWRFGGRGVFLGDDGTLVISSSSKPVNC